MDTDYALMRRAILSLLAVSLSALMPHAQAPEVPVIKIMKFDQIPREGVRGD
jgi:hypothetical protein